MMPFSPVLQLSLCTCWHVNGIPQSLMLCSIFLNSFLFLQADWIISFDLSSNSLLLPLFYLFLSVIDPTSEFLFQLLYFFNSRISDSFFNIISMSLLIFFIGETSLSWFHLVLFPWFFSFLSKFKTVGLKYLSNKCNVHASSETISVIFFWWCAICSFFFANLKKSTFGWKKWAFKYYHVQRTNLIKKDNP